MVDFTQRHTDKIQGVLSCFDRLILQGTLPDICHPRAIGAFFQGHGLRIFDFTEWAKPMREEIKEHVQSLAAEHGLEIEFIRGPKHFRKEQRIQEVLARRGDHPGIVHIFSVMESCRTFKPWHDKKTHATFFKYDSGWCLHYYVYFIDPALGLCFLRIPTWAPFRLEFYCNGHNWLASRLKRKGIGFQQVDNAFVQIDDFAEAQRLADGFSAKQLHRLLDRYARQFCPVVARFAAGIHWSVLQAEYATDLVFKDAASLAPVYEELVRTLCHAVKPDRVAMFLGKPFDPQYDGPLGSDLVRHREGFCLRHYLGPAGIKLYDKFQRVLRIETFTNDVSFFKHHRRVEHRDGTHGYATADLKKTIYSLSDLASLMHACNRRYLEFLGAVDDPTPNLRDVTKISSPVKQAGRSHRGFNLFHGDDAEVFRAIAQGNAQGFGIRSRTLQAILGKTPGQISRILKRLRNHGLIKKAAKAYKYHLTSLGSRVIAAALKLKEMFVIPSLRGRLQPA